MSHFISALMILEMMVSTPLLSAIPFSHESGCLVAIHSRLNHLATVHRFSEQASGRISFVSASDPICIKMHGLEPLNETLYIRQMYIDRLSYGAPITMYDRGLGNNYQDAEIEFYRLSLVLSDLSIREVLLHVQDGNGKRNTIHIEPTSWIRTVRPKTCTVRSRVNADDADDGFVEPDGRVDAQQPRVKSSSEPLRNLDRRKVPVPWYFSDYHSLYEALVATPSTDGGESALETADIDFVVGQVKQLLAGNTDMREPPLGTLLEYAGCAITIRDVDEASLHMQELFSVETGEHELKLQRIAEHRVLGLTGTPEPPNLLAIYDTLLHNWIEPLPVDVSATVRLHKERLARRIAADLMLATTQVRFYEELPESQPAPSQESLVPFPESSSQPTFSQPATQSQFGIPAVETRQEPPDSHQQHAVQDPLNRLQKYLSIEKPLPSSLPQGINRILTHWELGTDPSTYSWKATEEAITEELESHDEASQQRREKARKKQERREKRQQRENELFQKRVAIAERPQAMRSSPGPSLPVRMGPGVGSSQIPTKQQSGSGGPSQGLSQTFGGLVVQSQTVPGKHGARPEKKAKKKRKQGF